MMKSYLTTHSPLERSQLAGLHHIGIVHARMLLHEHLLGLALVLLLLLQLNSLLLKLCLQGRVVDY